nr:hypothetical protein [Streptomyces sp. SID7803]
RAGARPWPGGPHRRRPGPDARIARLPLPHRPVRRVRRPASDDPVVVLARLPYLSLERLIRARDPRSIGFVFRNCSYLSHLSIVLRELGIPPALVDAEAFDTVEPGAMVRLDSEQRAVVVEGAA